jgi:hypothetical protein
MARVLTAGAKTQVADEVARLVHLIELTYAAGPIRITTAPVPVVASVPRADGTLDGPFTFSAIGGELSYGEVPEGPELGGNATQIRLSAVDQTVIAAVLDSSCVGYPGSIWRCWLDANYAVVANPALLVAGYLNEDWTCEDKRPKKPQEKGSATITTRIVDLFSAFEQVRTIQTNLASHQSQPEQAAVAAGATLEHLFKYDTFHQYVAVLPTKRIQWGDTIFVIDASLPYQERGGLATSAQRGR